MPFVTINGLTTRYEIVGQDASHATSAARYLEEYLPKSEYWDVPVTQRMMELLAKVPVR